MLEQNNVSSDPTSLEDQSPKKTASKQEKVKGTQYVWSVEESERLYRVSEWSSGYFGINEEGNMSVTPKGPATNKPDFDLKKIVDQLRDEQKLNPPFVLRFPDILRSRIGLLIDSFQSSIDRFGYDGTYRGCFPVKVNQQREVFEEVTSYRHAKSQIFGLEVGTKAELLAALAEAKDLDAPMVCNGYKDAELIDLALYGQKAGINVTLVLERAEELELILQRSRSAGIRPHLGIRVKVSSEGSGKWASTAGGKGLFGLNAYEMIDAIDTLRNNAMLDCLTMLHYHQGSQIPDLNSVAKGVEEVAAIYTELLEEGAAIGTINIGGGLAVDYDGSKIASPSSKNYNLRQYTDTIVGTLHEYAIANNVPAPNIISESGRAVTTHYSVLVFEILRNEKIDLLERSVVTANTDCASLIALRDLAENFPHETPFDAGDLAVNLLTDCGQQFSDGRICLRELGEAQRLQSLVFNQVVAFTTSKWNDPRRLLNLPRYADYYYGNFSLFQSLPDSWAIGQLFPITPIHRLNEKPERSGIIADITCDCDGRIKNYIDKWDEVAALPLHDLKANEPYYVGAFLAGAYQETLGDFHNLLGRPAVATVRHDKHHQPEIEVIPGDTAEWMLEHVHFDKETLLQRISEKAKLANDAGLLSDSEQQRFVETYQDSLNGSSYLKYD